MYFKSKNPIFRFRTPRFMRLTFELSILIRFSLCFRVSFDREKDPPSVCRLLHSLTKTTPRRKTSRAALGKDWYTPDNRRGATQRTRKGSPGSASSTQTTPHRKSHLTNELPHHHKKENTHTVKHTNRFGAEILETVWGRRSVADSRFTIGSLSRFHFCCCVADSVWLIFHLCSRLKRFREELIEVSHSGSFLCPLWSYSWCD